MKKRVVLTGLGAVVPHGHSVAQAWPRIRDGESAVGRITYYDPNGHKTQIAAQVPEGFDAPQTCGPFALSDDAMRFVWGATREALAQAHLDNEGGPSARRAVVCTTGVGPATLGSLGGEMVRSVPPDDDPWKADLGQFFSQIADAPDAIEMRGFLVDDCAPLVSWMAAAPQTYNVASACAAGTHALADAVAIIERDEADVVVASGVCTGINAVLVNGFSILGALSTRNDDPEGASRPFDSDRDGFILAEGAATIVVESLDHALARGATPLAEVLGWGLSCDAYRLTDPEPGGTGMSLSMQRALEYAGLAPSDIDYVNAHGTSTPYNDAAETLAIRNTFGAHTDALPVSSSKSMFGHLIQAAGLLEAIVCVKSLEDGWIPPTINSQNQDPACDLDIVPNHGRAQDIQRVMSNSFGFGGQNATIILKRWESS